MPVEIEVEGKGTIEFPDGMSSLDMEQAVYDAFPDVAAKSGKRPGLLKERNKAQNELLPKILPPLAGAAGEVVRLVSESFPLTFFPRLAYEVERSIGLADPQSENPYSAHKPIIPPEVARKMVDAATTGSTRKPGHLSEAAKTVAADFISSMSTPAMATVAVAGAVPEAATTAVKAAGAALLGAFGGAATAELPAASEELGRVSVEGTPEEQTQALAAVVETSAIPILSAAAAAKFTRLTDQAVKGPKSEPAESITPEVKTPERQVKLIEETKEKGPEILSEPEQPLVTTTPPAVAKMPAPKLDQPGQLTKQQRLDSSEFDRLVKEYGAMPENNWYDIEKGEVSTGPSINAKMAGMMASAALSQARRKAFSHLKSEGLDPTNVADRAAMLPALKEHITKLEGREPVPLEKLPDGSEFTIAGEKFTVKSTDPDTGIVTIKDGTTMKVDENAVIKIDKGSLKAPEISTEFVPPEASTGEKVAKLRPGEKQGDILAKVQEPFALSGEKGVDFESRAREKSQRENELAEARSKQDREQTAMFGGLISTGGPPLRPSQSNVPSLTPKSQRQIITDLAKGMDLPIRFGRLRTNKFAGYFLKVQNLIGAKKANDIPIVSHEVGHKLDSTFGFASDPVLRTELDALGDPSMPGSRSSWTPSKSMSYKLGEGVAEFVRHWLTDPPQATKLAPNMLRTFNAVLDANKDFGDVMRTAQSDIQTWRNAEPQARLRSHISVGSNPNETPYTVSQLTRDLVDDLHFLRLAVDDAKIEGTDLPPSKNPYLLARNLRGSYGMADNFIRNGVADFKTKAVQLGTSLEDALKPVAGRVADFRDWIIAKRAQELHKQGRETGLVDSDVQATASRFDGDALFQNAFARVRAWNDALLQYAVDSGLVTEQGAEAMRRMNQDYVPLHRVFEVGAGEPSAVGGSGTGRGLNVGTPGSLKRLSGSPRDIVDPLETMVRNAYAIITASEKSGINRAVADMSKLPGMGKWVEHVATPKESVKVGLDKIREQLEAAGADLTGVPDDLLLQFFQNSSRAPFGENMIKVAVDGKPEFYRLKSELFETFNAMDLEDAGSLIRILSQPAQVLRAGVTVAPDFALANALRDAFTSAIVSRHGLMPFEAVVRGVSAMLSNPKLIAEWQASGGKNSIEASYFDRGKLQKFLAEKITKDLTPAQQALVAAKSPMQALRWLTSISEEATRIGEYQKAYSDLRRSGMPEGEARRLSAFEARDRQDFAKGGAKTKIVRRLAAFWNAGLQGNVRLAQAFKERPFQTTLRGIAFITLPKLLEQSLNWNDEDYWDRPQWERDLFFLIPHGKDDGGHTQFIRIPTPFEAGVLFGTFPGRILQTIKEGNLEAAKTFPLVLAKQTVPNPTPQWALTIFEDFMVGPKGWDVYRGRHIVPESISQLPPEMQWTEQTSLTARKLGDLFNFPPVKVDHIINSTTGGLGKQVTHQIVDRAISFATDEARTAKGSLPGGRFITTPAAVSSQSIEDFYKTLAQIKTAVAGQKKNR